MTDPRNIAHDKKVQQEKKHRHEEGAPGATHAVQPGKKPHIEKAEEPQLSDVQPPPEGEEQPKG